MINWGKSWFVVSSHAAVLLAFLPLVVMGACDRKAPPDASKPPSSGVKPPAATQRRAEAMPPATTEPVERLVPASGPPTTGPAISGGVTVPPWQPLRRTTPGEWAEYESMEGLRTRYDVQKVALGQVVTRVTVHQGGRTWGQPATREDEDRTDFLKVEAHRRKATRSCQQAVVEAAGRQWECQLYEDRWTDEDIAYVRRTWVSREVPFLGTVRMELYGADQLEARLVLVGWGKDGH